MYKICSKNRSNNNTMYLNQGHKLKKKTVEKRTISQFRVIKTNKAEYGTHIPLY